ncbi:PTPLA-domain-containing protein [Anaeromyces robustus]|jgi:very-long-chain (3R)-3-hydroxyacyl-CoA dehydratase|uniref:Very-long-chain (3R)-3-hydroxyacyl-CoA dehydratase n=1 Tax=Anaeromyces robustus TaxID=1754192 RepID=A0A1Y1X3J8_9FUNG|nr:PTPLA-domain-containing protein [Anaeromyces robustus]|eukprot:ORX80208.1 PTPLA-domain-containing protein [Anaeromyces robustus]
MAPKKATRATPKKAQASKPRKEKPLFVKLYLFLYNLLSFAGWGYVLFLVIKTLIDTNGNYTKVYDNIRNELTIVQACAALEILHSLIGFVPSPVFTTTCQVFSRVFVSYYILYYTNDPKTYQSPFLTVMVIAWSITEVVRYLYYALNIFKIHVKLLTWIRYTFFYVLYPVGASSECVLIYTSIPAVAKISKYCPYVNWVVLLSYVPFFPILYMHMIKQRKRVLGGKKKKTQ